MFHWAANDRRFLGIKRVEVIYFLKYPFFTTTAKNNKLPGWVLKLRKTNKIWKTGRTNCYESLENIPLFFREIGICHVDMLVENENVTDDGWIIKWLKLPFVIGLFDSIDEKSRKVFFKKKILAR